MVQGGGEATQRLLERDGLVNEQVTVISFEGEMVHLLEDHDHVPRISVGLEGECRCGR